MNFHYARKMKFAGGRAYNFGGDSHSDSSTSTLNDTDNWYEVTDKRNTVGDQAIGLSGDRNVVDRSSTNLSSWFDASNRSTTSIDNSDRSTTLNDSRNLSTMMFDSRNQSTTLNDSRNLSTMMFDSSNRSTDNSTYFNDASDRSTHFNDASNRSTAVNSNNISTSSTVFTDNSDNRVYHTTTDFGSVAAGVGLAGAMGTKAMDVAALMSGQAFGVANTGINGAIANLMKQSETGLEATKQAFDLVRSAGANNLSSSAAVLGMAQNAIEKSAAAFQEASDGGEKKTIMYAIGAVAIIAVAFAMNR